jgi:hypothetical protein
LKLRSARAARRRRSPHATASLSSRAFDQTQLAVARKLAQLLADDGEVSGSTLTTLLSLLPGKASDAEAAWDLSRLSDKQLEQLDVLAAVAAQSGPQAVRAISLKRRGRIR